MNPEVFRKAANSIEALALNLIVKEIVNSEYDEKSNRTDKSQKQDFLSRASL